MRELKEEIAQSKVSMNIHPTRIAELMRNARLSTMQAEDLMDIAEKLECVTPTVTRAYEHFNTMRRTKINRLDSPHENNLQMIEMMAKMEKDSRLYTILMAAYCLCGNAYRANALLRAMKDARIAPTREIYNLLISVNGKEGDLEKCTKLFDEMIFFNHAPNANTWNTLLFLHNRNGDIFTCAKLYDTMRNQEIAKCKSTYDMLLRIFGKKGMMQTCEILLEEMEDSQISRDLVTYNLLMESHAARGELDQCASLMDTMRAQGITPDTQTYTTFIRACAKHERFSLGIEAFSRMRAECVYANVLTYRSALACNVGLHAWDACMNLADDMAARAVVPDARMYQMMLEVCARMGDADNARALLEEMRTKRIEISEETKNIVVETFQDMHDELVMLKRTSMKEIMTKEEEAEEDGEMKEEELIALFHRTIKDEMDNI